MLSHKQISNRIKAKGLQKLKWYCQMCEKQCRDENGFKNHCDSNGHMKQMEVFSGKSSYIVEQFSKDFESEFMRLLSRRYPTTVVSANQVYNEFIKDRDHIHMNSTKWSSLSEFIMYLGKVSKCKVDETPKGWFIQYIDRDPETAARQEKKNNHLKPELTAEDREKLEISKKINKLNELYGNNGETYQPTELSLESLGKVDLKFNLNNNLLNNTSNNNNNMSVDIKPKVNLFMDDNNNNNINSNVNKKQQSALNEIMQLEAKKDKLKQQQIQLKNINNNKEFEQELEEEEDNWILEGIIVRIMEKELSNGKYYKQKAIIQSVHDKYIANLMVLDSNTQLKIDQNYLETVIPQIGGLVLILKGKYRGTKAKLLELNLNNYSATLELASNSNNNNNQNNTIQLPYEDFSKIL